MIFLTATKDLQHTSSYERVLVRLEREHGEVVQDRRLFKSNHQYKKTWKSVYGKASKLYVLARRDGTVGAGVYKQWRWLEKRGVPCALVIEGREEEEPSQDFVLERVAPAEPEDRQGEQGKYDATRWAVVRLDGITASGVAREMAQKERSEIGRRF